MNRYRILAVSFALVLIGILVIQAYWVRSVIEVRNKQFDYAVFSSLQSTVRTLEQKENITLISKAEGDTVIKRVYSKNAKRKRSKEPKVKVIQEKSASGNTHTTVSTSYSYQYSLTNDSETVSIISKSGPNQAAQAIIFAPDSTLELETENLSHEPEIEEKLSKIDILIHKMAAGAKDSVPVLPKGEEVEALIKSNLSQNNIDIPFYVGMKVNDTSAYSTSEADTGALFSSAYYANLFPNDVLKRNGSLFVSFSGKNAFIFSELSWMLITLLIFTLLILFMFYSTLLNFRKQKKLNELKSDFINNMTHELKTPLATIQLASEVILRHAPAVDPQIGQMAGTIKKQSKRMDEDVRNILQIALLESPKYTIISRSDYDLKQQITDIAESFSLLATEKNVSITINYRGKETILADKDLVGKAVYNLLDNALKYSAAGGEIKLDVQVNGNVNINVTDHGLGIAKEDLPYVFDKFYRAGSGNLHHNKGYGLGLSFVKKITELHGGKVNLVSEKNKGTCVTFSIPQA